MFCARLHTCRVFLWGTCQRGPCWANPTMTKEATPSRVGRSSTVGFVTDVSHVMASYSLHDLIRHISYDMEDNRERTPTPSRTQAGDRTGQGGANARLQRCIRFHRATCKVTQEATSLPIALFRAALSSRTYCAAGDAVLHLHYPKGQPLATCKNR